jgi:hypothetical protein
MLLDELFTSSPMAPRATIMHWHALTILRLKSYLHSFLGGKIWVGSCMGLSKYAIPDSIHWGGPPFETNSYPIGVHPFSFGKSPIYGWSIQKQFLIILRCPKFSDKPIMFPSCIACAYIYIIHPCSMEVSENGGSPIAGFFLGKYSTSIHWIK